MQKVMIRAARQFPYGGKTRFRGDEFEVPENEARTLTVTGMAVYGTRAMVADRDPQREILHLPAKSKRRAKQ